MIKVEWDELTRGWTVMGQHFRKRGKSHCKRQEYEGAFEDEKVQVLELKRNGHQLGPVGPLGSSNDGTLA